MLRKIGIVARIALIVTAALFVSQLVVVISYLHGERSPPPSYAIADRIAAAVRLLDETLPEDRQDVLAVARVAGFQVSVVAKIPEGFEDDFSFTRIRTLAQRMVDAHEPGRTVRVGLVDTGLEPRSKFLMTFFVGLRSGELAQFSVSDETTLRIWNVPIGFFAGFFGILVAIIAVFAVARETRPLSHLARAIDQLGNRIEPVQVKERGAKELRTLIRAINDMQGRILGLVNNRTLFLGAISHDLKTYLTRFRLRLEMMPAGAHREKAIQDVEAMEQLLNDVLLFARESSAGSEAETVELNAAVSVSATEAAPGGDMVRLALSLSPLNVRVPRKALRRVVDNLLSNALRYGTSARLRTEPRDGMACLIVEDDGPGIDEKDMPFVFEPFFRAEPSRNRSHGGTGLGLAIVRQILDAHGGTITLENKAGGSGLVATVCLPVDAVRR